MVFDSKLCEVAEVVRFYLTPSVIHHVSPPDGMSKVID